MADTPQAAKVDAARPDTGRADYDAAIRFSQLQPGEPVFLIRGQDAVGHKAVRAWAALAHEAGVPMAIVERALQQADALEAWPSKHLPDAGHLTADEVLQLQFQLERRAWDAREDCKDPRVMLAEERALTAALSRLHPVLGMLFAGLSQEPDGSWRWTWPEHEDRRVPGEDPFEALRRLKTVLREGAARG